MCVLFSGISSIPSSRQGGQGGKARLRLRRGQFGGLSVVVVKFQKPNGRVFSLHDHGYADMLSVSVLILGPVSFLAALSVPSREVPHLYWYR